MGGRLHGRRSQLFSQVSVSYVVVLFLAVSFVPSGYERVIFPLCHTAARGYELRSNNSTIQTHMSLCGETCEMMMKHTPFHRCAPSQVPDWLLLPALCKESGSASSRTGEKAIKILLTSSMQDLHSTDRCTALYAAAGREDRDTVKGCRRGV